MIKQGTIVLSLGLILSLNIAFNVGCGVKSASIQTLNVAPEIMRNFLLPPAGESIVLGNNQVFLWPEGLRPMGAARVFTISKKLDRESRRRRRLERRQGEILDDPILKKISGRMKEKKRELNSKKAALASVRSNLNERKKKLTKALTDLIAERSKPAPDVGKIAGMEQLISKYTQEVAGFESKIQALQDEVDAAQRELDALNRELDEAQSKSRGELDSISHEIDRADRDGERLIREVTNLVIWFDMSRSRVTFKKNPDGTLFASISQWVLDQNMNGRSFSTEVGETGPTIQNLKYHRRGGIFEFDVLVYEDDSGNSALRETFSFRVSRNEYQDEIGQGSEQDSQRTCFIGKVFRKRVLSDGQVEIKAGIVKLVDSSG